VYVLKVMEADNGWFRWTYETEQRVDKFSV
jgi:hypothetical protein